MVHSRLHRDIIDMYDVMIWAIDLRLVDRRRNTSDSKIFYSSGVCKGSPGQVGCSRRTLGGQHSPDEADYLPQRMSNTFVKMTETI